MSELNKYLCDDVIGIVGDYLQGDNDYWNNKYSNAINEMNQYSKNNNHLCIDCTMRDASVSIYIPKDYFFEIPTNFLIEFTRRCFNYCCIVNKHNTGKTTEQNYCIIHR